MGPQSIEEMKNLAVEMFSDIKFRGDVADASRSVESVTSVLFYLLYFHTP